MKINIDILIGNIIKVPSFFKILYLKIFGLNIPLFGWAVIYWLPAIRNSKNIFIWKWFQIWRLSRIQWNIKIWDNCFLNEFWSLNWNIEIWNDVMFWPWCYLTSWDHWFKKWELYRLSSSWKSSPIKIWNNVWVWAKVVILKGVIIWNNCVIWAGSVVTKPIPSNSVAVWNPCKVIKTMGLD